MSAGTTGTVIAVKRQWWLKINTKAFRKGTFDGATFPYIIKVKYVVNDKEYFKRKWINAGNPVPEINSTVTIVYNENKPSKSKIFL